MHTDQPLMTRMSSWLCDDESIRAAFSPPLQWSLTLKQHSTHRLSIGFDLMHCWVPVDDVIKSSVNLYFALRLSNLTR
ncbi:hypothetical protein M514_05554 [Trichuris suis]|uniref:Uncharacterized protein n=1 Tax=Trichuris suis TaxID=68888 RepID=A0A085MZI6_9BILA|nr:hypothetical protein M513_05554 [Trichuris suis]KFD62632.1 hypothetical protein M514_05554 [Trichuris suis]